MQLTGHRMLAHQVLAHVWICPAATMKRLGCGRPERTATQKAVPASSSVRLTSIPSSRPEVAFEDEKMRAGMRRTSQDTPRVNTMYRKHFNPSAAGQSLCSAIEACRCCRVKSANPLFGCHCRTHGYDVDDGQFGVLRLAHLCSRWRIARNATAPAHSSIRCRESLLSAQQPKLCWQWSCSACPRMSPEIS